MVSMDYRVKKSVVPIFLFSELLRDLADLCFIRTLQLITQALQGLPLSPNCPRTTAAQVGD